MRYQLFSPELLSGGPSVTVRFYEKLPPLRFAGGGLAQAAEAVRSQGRGGDEVLLHINPEEFKFLQKKWGEPSYNPHTGLPEYGFFSKIKKTLKKKWKKMKSFTKKIAPYIGIIAAVFFPALAPAIGTALGASGAAAAAVGNAVISGAAGAVTGGGKGALAGALSGGLGSYSGKIGSGVLGKVGAPELAKSAFASNVVGKALVGGATSKLQGGDFTSGAVQGGLTAAAMPTIQKMVGSSPAVPADPKAPGALPSTGAEGSATAGASSGPPDPLLSPVGMPDLEATTAGAASANIPQPGMLDTAIQGLKGYAKDNPLEATLGALSLAQSMGGSKGQEQGPPGLPPGFGEPLPQLDFKRDRTSMDPSAYYTYGSGAEHSFFDRNVLPEEKKKEEEGQSLVPIPRARGGVLGRMKSSPSPVAGKLVRGPGSGRQDLIDAKLSDGEYVFDAETVALLGDGSTDEGARRLDRLREKVRKHKGRELSKGKFSKSAKAPEDYLGV